MKTTKAGYLHANTKCQRCGKRRNEVGRIRFDPDTGEKMCDPCHTDVYVYGKAKTL